MDVYSLLGIEVVTFNEFQLLAHNVIDYHTKKVVDSNIRKLQSIEESADYDSAIKPSQHSIDEVISKIIKYAKKDKTITFSIRELRIVSYYLMKLGDDKVSLEAAVALLRDNWRNMFFSGVVFYLFNSWNLLSVTTRELLCELVKEKLKLYSDRNKRLIKLKNHADYFDIYGPVRMAALIEKQNIHILDAPSIIGYKQSSLTQSFYSDVIISYFKSQRNIDIVQVQSVLSKYGLDRTKKLLCAELVLAAEQSENPLQQTIVSRLAKDILGDISLATNWAPFTGAKQHEIDKLRRAQALVNLWITRKVVEVFFEVCVQDEDRKRFWLKHVEKHHISDFRIVGSSMIRIYMQNDSRTSGLFSRFFIETNSSLQRTAALVLRISDRVLIEFSDTGALYVYKPDRPIVKYLFTGRRSFDSVGELKLPSIGNLIEQEDDTYFGPAYTLNDEGRMTHRGYWQDRLNVWLKNLLRSGEVPGSSYGNYNNNVFKPEKKDKPRVVQEYDFSENAGTDDVRRSLNPPSSKDVDTSVHSKQPSDAEMTNEIVVLERFLKYKLSSKPFLGNKYRIVATENYFFLEMIGRGFGKLRHMKNGEIPIGSILVSKQKDSDYYRVTHLMMGRESVIGFVNESEDVVIFRDDLPAKAVKRIKLR